MGFDTKKAFDTVNKDLLRAAWIRLGIPPDIADYLMQLDSTGSTTIKSPHATSVYHQLGVDHVVGETTDADFAASFFARDGIGQGDSTSGNAWIALYDILLCMLDENPELPYFSRRDDQHTDPCSSYAYADDLNTVSPTLAHLQETLNIVSAYNSITGFSFNEKLDCGTNMATPYPDVIVHDAGWQARPISISNQLTIRILGVPVDLTNGWRDLKTYVSNIKKLVTLPLQNKNVSATTKLLTFQMAVLPAILYPAKFLDLTIPEYQALFAPLDAFLRRANNLQRTIHRQQLYGSRNDACLSITDVVAQVQKLKVNMLHRALKPCSPVRNSAIAIIERCYRQSVRYSS
jgi:hypothetical protein